MKDKSKAKFEVLGKRELLEVPLPLVEVWEELQAQVEQLTGEAGLCMIGTILENEVTRRVGPPHRPDPTSGAVRARFPLILFVPWTARWVPALAISVGATADFFLILWILLVVGKFMGESRTAEE